MTLTETNSERVAVALERIAERLDELEKSINTLVVVAAENVTKGQKKAVHRVPFFPLVSLSELLYGKDYQMYRDYYGPGYYQFFCVCRDLGIDTINELRSVPDKAFSPSDTESEVDQKWMSKRMLEIRDDILRHYEKEQDQ